MEGIQRKAGIFFPVGGKPAVVVPQFENGCKAGVNALTCSLGLGSDNGKRFNVSAVDYGWFLLCNSCERATTATY
jgi:hypothetical protein